MTNAVEQPGEFLEELMRLPAPERRARVESTGRPEAVLLELGEESQRLVSVEVARALAANDVITSLADEMKITAAQARARWTRARALANAGRYDDALDHCDQAIAIADEHNHVVEGARARLASMQPLAEQGRLDDAFATGSQAAEALRAAGETVRAGGAEMNLGIVHSRRDEPELALERFDRAAALLEGQTMLSGQVQINRGEALLSLNRFSETEASFRNALRCMEEIGANWEAALAEGNLADLAQRQGRLHRAIYHIERARRRFESDDAAGPLARLLAEQAETKAMLGLDAEAMSEFEASLTDLDALGLVLEAARARTEFGRLLVRLQRLDRAQLVLEEAAKMYESLGHGTAGARVLLQLADLHLMSGEIEQATALAREALGVLADRPADAASVHHLMARLAIENNQLHEAREHADAGIDTTRRLDLAPLLADLLHTRGRINRITGDTGAALADLHAAVDQIERVRGALQAERFRTAFLGSRLTTYEDLVRTILDHRSEQSIAEAFAVAERARSRSLLDMVNQAIDYALESPDQRGDSAEAALREKLEALRGDLNALYSKLNDTGGADGTRRLGPHWHESVATRERELEAIETRLSATSGPAGLYAPPIELESAYELCPPDGALVKYFLAGDELIAFVLREGRATVHRNLATADIAAEMAQRIHFQFARALRPGALNERTRSRLLDDARHELRAAYDAFVAPLRESIGAAKRLIIIPHGPLHLLPFHALHDGDSFLIELMDVQYAPSVSVLSHLTNAPERTGEERSGDVVVGVADEFAPHIEREAQRIASVLECDPDHVFLNEAATAENVHKAVGRSRVVHLACHGRFSAETPLGSGIRLADRWLTVRDIYAGDWSADLITLSGCETGRSMVRGGDELVGLLRGFIAGGAASLVVSLWRVDDESTAELMSSFYDTWRETGDKAASLRRAQCEVMKDKAHPVFWAPFILVGLS